jgi:hypothetical protein
MQVVYIDPVVELRALEFEYCLPKSFWTSREWSRYVMKRSEYVYMIREEKEYWRMCEMYRSEDV